MRKEAAIACSSLIADLTLYLTDFLNRIFSGENAKNHDFCGGEKLEGAAVYQAAINHGSAPWEQALCSRCLYLFPCSCSGVVVPIPEGFNDLPPGAVPEPGQFYVY